ncbi:unnamed protein product [Moneuplotes crassus]|uniref:WW domain-containing protein n=1 Tax=Euplotes crassus TaxID=5936 RepID=A0AAD1Y9Q0_EUPCR|nr:unnamed protein product [Moneuplotes crassus]
MDSSKKSKKKDYKETRENRFGERISYTKRLEIDRKNEININPESLEQLNVQNLSKNQYVISDNPTDSMMVNAIDRRTLGNHMKRMEDRRNFEQPTLEESSYNQHEIPRLNFKEQPQWDQPERPSSQLKRSHKIEDDIKNDNAPRIQNLSKHQKNWEVKATSKGFIYFKQKDNPECQWDVPRAYDPFSKKYKPIFNYQWQKIKNSQTGAKFWKNLETEMTQSCNPFKKTYIFEAAMDNNLAFLELYCCYGGDINLTDNKKRTPLHHACANGNFPFVTMLIKLGAKIDEDDYAMMTPIFYTVKYHHKQCLRALIEAGADLEVTKANGDTLIHEAAIYDSADCLIELAQHGLAINIKNNILRTPLSLAQKKKSKYAYQALLNLEKAITMTNAFIDREYGDQDTEKIRKSKLKSSLKKAKDPSTPKKKVRINEEEEYPEDQVEISKEDQTPIQEKNDILNRLNKLASLRSSLRSSNSNISDFTKYATKALQSNRANQDELLQEILEYEKEEIKNVEQILRQSQLQKEKEKKIEQYGQKEKLRRWQIIQQKRDQKLDNIQKAKAKDHHCRRREGEIEKLKEPKKDNPMNNYLIREKMPIMVPKKKKKPKALQQSPLESSQEVQEEQLHKEESKIPEEPEEEESEIEEELDFKEENRSFEDHPLDEQHNSEITEEEEIRMSKSTLRQIKVKKRNRSAGPPGRAPVYLDANSYASQSMKKLGKLWKRFKDFLNRRYENIKEWITAEEEDKKTRKKRPKSKPVPKRKPSEELERIGRREMIFEPERRLSKSKERGSSHVEPAEEVYLERAESRRTAKDIIFEKSTSEIVEEAPSKIILKKIAMLKAEERKLKEIEAQIKLDLKNSNSHPNDIKPEVPNEEVAQNPKPKKKRKGRKKKKKVHHDMKKMKKRQIQKIMNQGFSSSEHEPEIHHFVKKFKSDHESYTKSNVKDPSNEREETEQLKAEKIVIEPLNNEIVQIGVEEVQEIEEPKNVPLENKLIAPIKSAPSPKPPNSPKVTSEHRNLDKAKRGISKFVLDSKTPKMVKHSKSSKADKNAQLLMKEYSDHSVGSENIRYKSVERPRNFFDRLALPEFTKNYSGSKYSLSHNSENNSNKSEEEKNNPHMHSVGSLEKIPAFELKNVKQDDKDSKSDVVEIHDEEKDAEPEKTPRVIQEARDKDDIDEPQKKQSSEVPLTAKEYNEIVKESLDFATFLKNQAKELESIRDSNLSDALKVQRRVEKMIKSPKSSQLKQSSDKTSNMRKTLDFIYSDSDESLENPDPQEIKEGIAEFKRRSLIAQSEGLLKNIKKAVENAKLCLSNNDFSNPVFNKLHMASKEMPIQKKNNAKHFEDDLDDLIDDDFLQSTPSNQKHNEENKQIKETLQDELNEIYNNYAEGMFNNEDSLTCTPRGFSNLKSVTTKKGSSKKILQESYGIYQEDDIHSGESKEPEIPFAMAEDPSTPKDPSANKVDDYVIKPSPKVSDSDAESRDNNDDAPPNIVTLNINKSKPKRPSSLGATPSTEKKQKRRIPKVVKEKLMSLTREGSVIRKYSAEKFKEPTDGKATNSIDRLKQNIAKFKKNAMFRKGSESERSVKSILSRESQQ